MVWANRGRDLLASSAAKTPKISMGKPAARRVTDVLRGDWRTERPLLGGWGLRERVHSLTFVSFQSTFDKLK